ncbi:transcription elongation factor S-II [Aethina tumida]|uniref:transcription elongation factor S-II n=1 Tax=Aethina tumida TaxID=116153 RepID=UPI00096B5FD3|nr:transcription elongation factor S-II [Aethina tumida]
MPLIDKVMKIQKRLSKHATETGYESKQIKMLKELERMNIDVDALTKSKVGLTVNQLKKASKNEEILTLSKNLLKNWKVILAKVNSKASPEASPRSGKDDDKENLSHENNALEVSQDTDHKPPKEKPINSNEPSGKEPIVKEPIDRVQVPVVSARDSGDPIREKFKVMLANAIKTNCKPEDFDGCASADELAAELEMAIFAVFKNTEMRYRNRIRSRISNLTDPKNPTLRTNFRVGAITAARLAEMSAEEMASDEVKMLRDQFTKEAINYHQLATAQGTKTDMLKCGKCKKKNCTYNQLQTRSADEPMTTFVLCNECGNRWKFC